MQKLDLSILEKAFRPEKKQPAPNKGGFEVAAFERLEGLQKRQVDLGKKLDTVVNRLAEWQQMVTLDSEEHEKDEDDLLKAVALFSDAQEVQAIEGSSLHNLFKAIGHKYLRRYKTKSGEWAYIYPRPKMNSPAAFKKIRERLDKQPKSGDNEGIAQSPTQRDINHGSQANRNPDGDTRKLPRFSSKRDPKSSSSKPYSNAEAKVKSEKKSDPSVDRSGDDRGGGASKTESQSSSSYADSTSERPGEEGALEPFHREAGQQITWVQDHLNLSILGEPTPSLDSPHQQLGRATVFVHAPWKKYAQDLQVPIVWATKDYFNHQASPQERERLAVAQAYYEPNQKRIVIAGWKASLYPPEALANLDKEEAAFLQMEEAMSLGEILNEELAHHAYESLPKIFKNQVAREAKQDKKAFGETIESLAQADPAQRRAQIFESNLLYEREEELDEVAHHVEWLVALSKALPQSDKKHIAYMSDLESTKLQDAFQVLGDLAEIPKHRINPTYLIWVHHANMAEKHNYSLYLYPSDVDSQHPRIVTHEHIEDELFANRCITDWDLSARAVEAISASQKTKQPTKAKAKTKTKPAKKKAPKKQKGK